MGSTFNMMEFALRFFRFNILIDDMTSRKEVIEGEKGPNHQQPPFSPTWSADKAWLGFIL